MFSAGGHLAFPRPKGPGGAWSRSILTELVSTGSYARLASFPSVAALTPSSLTHPLHRTPHRRRQRWSALNGLRHSFRSQSVLIPGDDPAQYQDLLDDLTTHFGVKPGDITDPRYVREMADAEWRLRRIRLLPPNPPLRRETRTPIRTRPPRLGHVQERSGRKGAVSRPHPQTKKYPTAPAGTHQYMCRAPAAPSAPN